MLLSRVNDILNVENLSQFLKHHSEGFLLIIVLLLPLIKLFLFSDAHDSNIHGFYHSLSTCLEPGTP